MRQIVFGNATYDTIKWALGFDGPDRPYKQCRECHGYLSVQGGSRNVKVSACIHFEDFAGSVVDHLDVKKRTWRHADATILENGGWNGTEWKVRRDDLTASRKEVR
mgnify:FL=1